MSDIIKLADLNKEQKSCFIQLEKGIYVLARKLADYPWDRGSRWTLMRTDDGQLAIARQVEDSAEDDSTGIGVDKCTCGAKMKELIQSGNVVRYCEKCDGNIAQAMQKTAAMEMISEEIPTALASSTIVTSSYYGNTILPQIMEWVEEGWDDFSSDGLNKVVAEKKDSGKLSEGDAKVILDNTEDILNYAKAYKQESARELFEEVSKSEKPARKSASKIANLLSHKPANLSEQTFLTTYKKLKEFVNSNKK